MKKIFLIAATALMAFTACEEKTNPAKPDSIEITPSSKAFDAEGGNVSVMVTSSGDWTLEGDCEWAEPSAISGADGDLVKFTVSPNATEEKLDAEFVFVCGKAEAKFALTLHAGDIPSIKLLSEASLEKDYNEGNIEVLIELEEGMDYHNLTYKIEPEGDWLTFGATLEGEEANTATMAFVYPQLEGLDAREAVITVSYPEAEPVTVNVKQFAKPTLEVSQKTYKLEIGGGNLEIPVTANVEYEITYSEGAEEWLTQHTTQENVEKWTYTAWEGSGKRSATITFTEKNPAEGSDALVATVSVFQSDKLISMAADMTDSRAQFADQEKAKTCAALKLGQNATMEVLVKLDHRPTGVVAIAGIERRFLIRYNDLNNNIWEVICASNNMSGVENQEIKTSAPYGNLEAGKWTHLAVTVSDDGIILYKDGQQVAKQARPLHFKDIDIAETYNANNALQRFSLSWAYDDGRAFPGIMSEVRVWNRALSAEELQADNHFYTVDPDSEGLVGYWKLDDAEGTVFHDYTANGNDLVGQLKPLWNANVKWVEVGLPE